MLVCAGGSDLTMWRSCGERRRGRRRRRHTRAVELRSVEFLVVEPPFDVGADSPTTTSPAAIFSFLAMGRTLCGSDCRRWRPGAPSRPRSHVVRKNAVQSTSSWALPTSGRDALRAHISTTDPAVVTRAERHFPIAGDRPGCHAYRRPARASSLCPRSRLSRVRLGPHCSAASRASTGLRSGHYAWVVGEHLAGS